MTVSVIMATRLVARNRTSVLLARPSRTICLAQTRTKATIPFRVPDERNEPNVRHPRNEDNMHLY